MRVGIYAPYSRQETTWMALALARRIERWGHDVQFASAGGVRSGVDPSWDSRVKALPASSFVAWTATINRLVCFVPPPVVTPPWLAVIGWHRWRSNQLTTWQTADLWVAPYPLCARQLGHYRDPSTIVCSRWSYGVVSPGDHHAGDFSLLCHVDRQAADHWVWFLSCLSAIRLAHPQLRLGCAISASLPGKVWEQLGELFHDDPTRVYRRVGLHELTQLIPQYTWHLCLQPGADAGGSARLASDLCVPSLVPHLPPYTEFNSFPKGVPGHLIQARPWHNWLGAPKGRMEAKDLVEAVGRTQWQKIDYTVLEEDSRMNERQFDACWRELLLSL